MQSWWQSLTRVQRIAVAVIIAIAATVAVGSVEYNSWHARERGHQVTPNHHAGTENRHDSPRKSDD